MRRRWDHVDPTSSRWGGVFMEGDNLPEWEIRLDIDLYRFCERVVELDNSRRFFKADLEELLDEPGLDRGKRRAPVVLFVPDTINLIESGKNPSILELIRQLVPPGYTVLASNNFRHVYSDFYTGIDDALPSLVIATKTSRVKSYWHDEAYYSKVNFKKVCKRRGIPLIMFPGEHHACKEASHIERISALLRDSLPKVTASLPPVDDEHFAKMFGVYYPIGEFEDRGKIVRMPYAVMGGERVPIIASATMVLQHDKMYLMMQEAKKGSGEKRTDVSKWEFPGGRIEEGETPDKAALRELSEETPYVGRVNGLVGVFARVNANGRLIMKAAYTGVASGRHSNPLADDSLGHGFFDAPTIRYLQSKGLLKTSDQLAILQEAAKIGMKRSLYKVADVDHPGVVRLLDPE